MHSEDFIHYKVKRQTYSTRDPWVMVDWHLTRVLRTYSGGDTSVFREWCPGNACPHAKD